MTEDLDRLVSAARRAIEDATEFAESGAMPEAAGAFASAARDLDEAVQLAVLEARRGGSSWTEVGSALGVSRQAARERWHLLEGQA